MYINFLLLLSFILSLSFLNAGTFINKLDIGARSEIERSPLVESNKETTTIRDKIKDYFEKTLSPQQIEAQDKKYFRNSLHKFYYERDYMPLWVKDGYWLKSVDYARKMVEFCDSEGLLPPDYKAIHTLSDGIYKTEADLAKAEIEITKVVVKYIKDLKHGRVSQAKIKTVLPYPQKEADPFRVLNEGFGVEPNGGFLLTLTVETPQYQALKLLLSNYRKMQAEGVKWPKIAEDVPLKINDNTNSTEAVRLLRGALVARGYLKEETDPKLSKIFDEDLEDAVKAFQKQHVIEADGVVGPQTRQALNTSVKDRIYQILTVMERWRWMPEHLSRKYILVNIPMFDLKAYENGIPVLEMSIIVGQQYRKTPTFTSEIKFVRFNPSWHIPSGIFMKDKLPKILEDPGYVSKMGYVVYNSKGHRLDPQAVDWGSGDYRLVQPPSDKNALGKIRFTLATTNDIYLHGTSQQELFTRQVRTFSSGCIRVEDPTTLAYWLFNDPTNWSLEKIKEESSGNITKNMPLPQPIDIHIVYFTVQVDNDGKAYFANDIYHQDEIITNEIKKMYHDSDALTEVQMKTLQNEYDKRPEPSDAG